MGDRNTGRSIGRGITNHIRRVWRFNGRQRFHRGRLPFRFWAIVYALILTFPLLFSAAVGKHWGSCAADALLFVVVWIIFEELFYLLYRRSRPHSDGTSDYSDPDAVI